jgi:hypothetical protein
MSETNKSIDYTVTDNMIDEAIIQEIYLQVGFKTSICILILNTGAEVLGQYSPLSPENLDISLGKRRARENALFHAKKQLEAIGNWRQTIDMINKTDQKADKKQ